MENLIKGTRVVVTDEKGLTWMGVITEILWNIKPPKKGMTQQGYQITPESTEMGGLKVRHHSQVKKAKSPTPLKPKKRRQY